MRGRWAAVDRGRRREEGEVAGASFELCAHLDPFTEVRRGEQLCSDHVGDGVLGGGQRGQHRQVARDFECRTQRGCVHPARAVVGEVGYRKPHAARRNVRVERSDTECALQGEIKCLSGRSTRTAPVMSATTATVPAVGGRSSTGACPTGHRQTNTASALARVAATDADGTRYAQPSCTATVAAARMSRTANGLTSLARDGHHRAAASLVTATLRSDRGARRRLGQLGAAVRWRAGAGTRRCGADT